MFAITSLLFVRIISHLLYVCQLSRVPSVEAPEGADEVMFTEL